MFNWRWWAAFRDLALAQVIVIIAAMNRCAAALRNRNAAVMRRRARVAAAVLCGGVLASGFVNAIEQASFEVDRIDGAGWSAQRISIQLSLPERTSATARIERLTLASQQQELRNVRVDCGALDISAAAIVCSRAQLSVDASPLGKQSLTGRIAYARADGALDLRLDGLRVGGGKAGLTAALQDAQWKLAATLDRVAIEPVMKLAAQWQLPVAQFTASGTASGSIEASGRADALQRAALDITVKDLVASNPEGTLASDKLSFRLAAQLAPAGHDRSFQARFESALGQAYAEPIFLDFGAHPLQAEARGAWRSDGVFRIDEFHLDHQAVSRAQGSAVVDPAAAQPVRALQLDLETLQFPGAYETYLQPLLLDTNFKSLRTRGEIHGRLAIADGAPRSAELHLETVGVDDDARNLVLRSVNGDVFWRAADDRHSQDDGDDDLTPARESTLSWDSGVLLNLDLGAARLRFTTQGRQVRLLQPTRLPVLDGAIGLDSFRVRNAGLPSVAFMIDATIEPISVRQLCQAFGWPEFGGRIGGSISKLRLRDNVITLGTALEASVFDGRVSISDLRLEQPFSQWPRFQSSIALDNLDLDLVTSAFSFGSITGRLSGSINGLKLFNWQPVAFDARLFTPPGDRSRHRISQRAVQNIGNIGGGGAGVTAALSSGVMRFFNDFNYDRLGISCRLENDVCVLDGIAPAPNGGYYLVKGKGLPRIDVIGGAHRVDWPRLVQQLIAVTQSNGPVVQ